METVKVEIIKSSSNEYWYNSEIGKVFEVYKLRDNEKYLIARQFDNRTIGVGDCIELGDDAAGEENIFKKHLTEEQYGLLEKTVLDFISEESKRTLIIDELKEQRRTHAISSVGYLLKDLKPISVELINEYNSLIKGDDL